MMFSFRQSAVAVGTVITLLLLLLCLLSFVLLITRGALSGQTSRLYDLPSQIWWMSYGGEPQEPGSIAWNLSGLLAFLLICNVLVVAVRKAYDRTASSEVFFFLLFLFSLPFESIRGVNALLIHMETPAIVYRILTRVVLFGRFLGLICLLFSSLYAGGIQFQKFSTIFLASAAASLVLAYALPLDRSVLLSTFMNKLGDEVGAWFAVLAIQIFVFINYLIAAIKRQKALFLLALLSIAAVLTGREFLLFFSTPLRIISGLLLTTAGVFGFTHVMNRVYQWAG